MSDGVRENRQLRSPLTPGELSARRREARRRRTRRRRTAALTGLGAVAVVIAVLVIGSGASSSGPTNVASGPTQSTTTKDKPPADRRPRPKPKPPTEAQLVAPILAYTSYVRLAGDRKREVALSFDDGPSTYTPQILAILRRTHTPATFFVIGRSAKVYPQYVHDEAVAHDDVGDHTEDHPPLDQLSASAQTAEITDAAAAIRHAGAPQPVLLRPPYGAFNDTTLQILHDQHMLMVLWSVDTSDYERPGTDKIIYTALSGAQPGAVILMHDGGGDRSETVAALPRIIAALRHRHYKLVTVAQLVHDDPPPHNQPPPTPLSGGI
jgi:peptidoglycan/xylan/chitin deacetylase (PgdA/CDA1 family)